MGSDIQEDLEERLNQFEALPFLFVGSGLSKRYIDLEDWESLLAKFSDILRSPFSFYRSSAGGNLALVGKLIAQDYHKYWYKHSDEETISNCETDIIDSSSPLKIDISRYLLEKSAGIKQDGGVIEELELLRKANFEGIITTNWDILLEKLFPDFHVYVGQEELLNSTPQMIGEIYKIHGSCTSPNSLVLTSDDYEKYSEKNPYLIAKLLTIFIEHPIIFLGYSFRDETIQGIIDNIISCLSKENIKRMEKQFIFVEWDEKGKGDQIYNDYSTFKGKTIPITVIRTNDFSAVFRALGSLERKIPTRVLRQIKEQLYEIVVKNDPKDRIAVLVDINNEEDLQNIRFVLGVGELPYIGPVGYRGIMTRHVIRDLVFDDLDCDPEHIINKSWSNLRGKWIPLFKYLQKGGYIGEDGILEGADLPPKILEHARLIAEDAEYFDQGGYDNKRREIRESNKGIPEMVKLYGAKKMLYYITLMERDKINIKELEDYLRAHYTLFERESSSGVRSYYHRLVCVYDWLRYGSLMANTVKR